MNTLLNIIWFIFGGLLIAIEYALWPFGTAVAPAGWPSGCLAGIMNIIWWFVGGIPIAITHLGWGILFCITIIGIPFGLQHFKLMRLALFPFGKEIQ